jgi:DNA-binding response OmpR family regulator
MRTILLIDDSDEVMIAVECALESLTCKVDLAMSIKEGLQKINAHPYDLLIVDRMLPDGDGLELLKEVRVIAKYQNTPFIFLTGKEDEESKSLALSLGAASYFIKPFRLDDLRDCVQKLLFS